MRDVRHQGREDGQVREMPCRALLLDEVPDGRVAGAQEGVQEGVQVRRVRRGEAEDVQVCVSRSDLLFEEVSGRSVAEAQERVQGEEVNGR